MITKVTGDNLEAFLASHEYLLLLIDPDWNNRKEVREQFERIAKEAETAEGVGDVGFGEADSGDERLWNFLRGLPVLNVPAVSYLWNRRPVKTVIGTQDIKEQVRYLFEDVENGWF